MTGPSCRLPPGLSAYVPVTRPLALACQHPGLSRSAPLGAFPLEYAPQKAAIRSSTAKLPAAPSRIPSLPPSTLHLKNP